MAALALTLGGCSAVSAGGSPSRSAVAATPVPTDESEVDATFAECMSERGWTQNSDGGYSIPNDQLSLLQADIKECTAEIEANIEPWDDADWEKVYEGNIETANCLIEHGYSVPEQPSFQVFKDTYHTEQTWDPYANIPSDEVQKVIETECAQPDVVY
ncbi:MAG: hypothetical protein QM635_06935 [Microbacteriaceae bacterium]